MRKAHAIADFLEHGEQLIERELREHGRVAGAELQDHVGERDALHQLHRVEEAALRVGAEIVHGHDVRVGQLAKNRASCKKRCLSSSLARPPRNKTFIATARENLESCASNTAPIPPRAISRPG